MKDSKTGTKFGPAELISEAVLLLIAGKSHNPSLGIFKMFRVHKTTLTRLKGSDTSRVVITSTIFYYLYNLITLELLQIEVRAVFDNVKEIYIG